MRLLGPSTKDLFRAAHLGLVGCERAALDHDAQALEALARHRRIDETIVQVAARAGRREDEGEGVVELGRGRHVERRSGPGWTPGKPTMMSVENRDVGHHPALGELVGARGSVSAVHRSEGASAPRLQRVVQLRAHCGGLAIAVNVSPRMSLVRGGEAHPPDALDRPTAQQVGEQRAQLGTGVAVTTGSELDVAPVAGRSGRAA